MKIGKKNPSKLALTSFTYIFSEFLKKYKFFEVRY